VVYGSSSGFSLADEELGFVFHGAREADLPRRRDTEGISSGLFSAFPAGDTGVNPPARFVIYIITGSFIL